LRTRFGRTGRMEELEEAIRRYRHACGLGAIVAPQETLNASRNWGRWALRRASWPEVEEAYSQGLAAGRALQRRQLRRTDKESYLADMQEMAPAAAYAIARAGGSPARAAHTLELGRALLLGEALQLNRRDLDSLPAALKVAYDRALAERRHLEAPDVIVAGNRLAAIEAADREFDAVIETIRTAESFTDFLADPTFAQIQSAAQDGPLVYLLASEAGGLALIVPGGAADQEQKPSFSEKLGFSAGAVEAVWLDGLTEAQLRAWLMGPADDPALGGWLGAYQAWLNERTPAAKTHWYDVMETTLRQAWDAALGPVVAALARYGVPAESMVTLIPSGLLALLPLHAAWTEDPAARPAGVAGCAATGRTYVLDCFAVAYAPSATALRHAQGVAAQAGAGALLAVDEPQPVAAGDLPNSAAEVAAIAELFAGPPPQMLRHSTATRAATLAALPGAQVAHFSCHGGTNWQDALQSGLLLANNELLTVGELLDQRLPGARLITLSACETGIVGAKLPDDAVALPAALVQAGFAGVAASLWSVYDISTAMLMVRFYELWRKEGLAPPAALCAAQRWVRDTSNAEKADHFGREFMPGGAKMSAAVAAPFFEEVFKRGSGEERTFAHPIWWAAFTYTGV
ncbi:MAG TPA: CHAT domain-containing protein, partial [Caldilinea sp.]|nr:CHAT domain-containing protein [Caldilinea sp.]